MIDASAAIDDPVVTTGLAAESATTTDDLRATSVVTGIEGTTRIESETGIVTGIEAAREVLLRDEMTVGATAAAGTSDVGRSGGAPHRRRTVIQMVRPLRILRLPRSRTRRKKDIPSTQQGFLSTAGAADSSTHSSLARPAPSPCIWKG
ncbi:hypothetical protein OH77DRAFT_349574 [Trametes cingulata]|nr:hypothetical protein OH77DRAFT_349574 [Trametes cingulata]